MIYQVLHFLIFLEIIDLNEYDEEIKKEQNRLTLENEFQKANVEDLFTSNLFGTILKYSKDIFDFKNPKITTNIDIYDENLVKFLEYSIEESTYIYRAFTTSIIMEHLKDELKKIDDINLSPSNILKKKHLIRLADMLAKLRVPDSKNLKIVYDIFKHPTVKFD